MDRRLGTKEQKSHSSRKISGFSWKSVKLFLSLYMPIVNAIIIHKWISDPCN